jgi:hypothetical protein
MNDSKTSRQNQPSMEQTKDFLLEVLRGLVDETKNSPSTQKQRVN